MKYDIEETKCPLYMVPPYVDAYIGGLEKNFNAGIKWHLLEFDHCHGRFFVKEQELNESGQKISKFFSKEENFRTVEYIFTKVLSEWEELFKQLKDFPQPVYRLFFLYKKFNEKFYEILSWSLICETLDCYLENILSKKVKSQYLPDIIASPFPSFIRLEEEELLNTDDMVKHAEKYFWIHGSHWKTEKLPISYFVERKKELEKNKPKPFDSSKIIYKKKQILDQVNADEEIRFLVSLNDFAGHLHDRRKAWFLKYVYYSHELLTQIGKQFGYSLDEMVWMMPEEILELSKGVNIDHVILHKRSQYMVLLSDPNHTILYESQADNIMKEINNNILGDQNSIKGITANRGTAKGVARVLSTPDTEIFNKGDILITSMTRPDFVPLMKLAGAIITNEGGLTCHAAIIARELGIPCIIGTKNATKKINNGDLLEVDANTGIINIITN